jgi:hypothetical protein
MPTWQKAKSSRPPFDKKREIFTVFHERKPALVVDALFADLVGLFAGVSVEDEKAF